MFARRLRPMLPTHRSQFRLARPNSTYQPPDPQPPRQDPQTNRHREFYHTFGRAWLKNFLISVATYQVLYLGWKKLESAEVKHDAEGEISALQAELRELTGKDKK